jgi:signal transduction histidine kinase
MSQIDQAVRVEQVRLLYAGLPVTLVASLVTGVVLVVIQWSVISPAVGLGWLAMHAGITAIRAWPLLGYRRSGAAAGENPGLWLRRFRIITLIGGLAWGLAGYLLFPPHDVTHQAFLSFVLAGIAVGAMTSFAIDPQVLLLFLVPTVTPLFVRFLLDGSVIAVGMAGLSALFLAFVATNTRRLYRDFHENIRLRMEYKKAEQTKDEFISVVSHELRTPLTSIRGSLGLVIGGVAGELPDDARELVSIALRNTRRLTLLINDILDVQKIESGTMVFEMRRQALVPLVQQALEANRGYADELGVRLRLTDESCDAAVNVDAERFMQVMANLLSNAIKFSPRGHEVEVTMQANGRTVRTAITDHGTGIPEAFRKRIFRKFSQVDTSDRRTKGGTGLGLYISKAIVDRMDGTIGYDSAPGEKTTFYFDLPRAGTPAEGGDHSQVADDR